MTAQLFWAWCPVGGGGREMIVQNPPNRTQADEFLCPSVSAAFFKLLSILHQGRAGISNSVDDISGAVASSQAPLFGNHWSTLRGGDAAGGRTASLSGEGGGLLGSSFFK